MRSERTAGPAPETSASSRDDGRSARLPLVTARGRQLGEEGRRSALRSVRLGAATGHWPWPPRSVVICLVCEPVRGPRPPVWFLAGPVGHLSADRWQPPSYRVPAVARGTDAGRRSAARSPRSAFVLAGGRSQPGLLDERMSVGCPGGGVTTGSEPAPAGAAPGLGRGCARVTGGGYRQVPLPDRHAECHRRRLFRQADGVSPGRFAPSGPAVPGRRCWVVEGDLLICCEPQPRVGRRRRGKQGECRDEHLGCLAGAEPAGEGQPR